MSSDRNEPGADARRLLARVAANAAVTFDPAQRRWVPAAHAHAEGAPVPELDGDLLTAPDALAEAADDFGHVVHHTPLAVLRPGSIRDVQKLVSFASEHAIPVSMRGQGHSVLGQAMVRAGVVIDSRSLSKIERVSPRGAVVEAGARWSDVLRAALAQGLTPPVLTDYLELSVGGTLSVGGIGGHTQHHGLQTDNVLELDVVTGKGELVTCSETQRRTLFDAVLGGLGQFGIIVRATLKLVPAATHARAYQLYYTDLGAFSRDQRAALDDGRFHYLEGQVIVLPDQSTSYMLEAAAYYTPPEALDDAVLLAGLSPIPARTQIQDYSYFDWQNRLAPAVEFFESTGQWSHPHPFFDLFLPESRAQAYVADVLAQLTLFDMGGGPILLYPFHRAALKRPFSIMPASDVVYLFDLLRFAPPDAVSARELVARNRALYDRARPLGAKRYPISAVHFRFPDWADHFGSVFERFSAAKAEFDPRHILGSGQGIFPGPRPSEEAEWAETQ